jgi:hypothetical protein
MPPHITRLIIALSLRLNKVNFIILNHERRGKHDATGSVRSALVYRGRKASVVVPFIFYETLECDFY